MPILEFAHEFRLLAEEPRSWDSFVIRCTRSGIFIYNDEIDERKVRDGGDKLYALLDKMDQHPAHGGIYVSDQEPVDDFPYTQEYEELSFCRASSNIF